MQDHSRFCSCDVRVWVPLWCFVHRMLTRRNFSLFDPPRLFCRPVNSADAECKGGPLTMPVNWTSTVQTLTTGVGNLLPASERDTAVFDLTSWCMWYHNGTMCSKIYNSVGSNTTGEYYRHFLDGLVVLSMSKCACTLHCSEFLLGTVRLFITRMNARATSHEYRFVCWCIK